MASSWIDGDPVKSDDIVIVGASESENIGIVPDVSAMGLAIDSALRALDDAGLTPQDVDGIAGTMHPAELALQLGTRPRYVDGTNVGGCSYMLHVRHAVAALRTGMASTVVIMHGESGRSRVGVPMMSMDMTAAPGQFERIYGVAGTFSMFTLPVMAYLNKYGLDESALAEVSVAQSKWAAQQPRALRQKIVTVDDVLNSSMIAWPFRVLECCPLTDGGGSLVLTTAARAADMDLKFAPVLVAGTGELVEGAGSSFMEDLTSFRAFRESSAEAFRSAEMTVDDIDHLMIYDAYAHLPLYGLEDLGFVGKGEAAEFIKSGATSPGGSLPMNTNGGGIMYTHTGMYGMFALQEAVRQMRGTSPAQVDGVQTSFVQGVGGMFAAAGSVILRKQ
ncbi:MAG: thiolase [Actinomycetota bacterium]|nr:thiolase [Actinomycetota bacterium]